MSTFRTVDKALVGGIDSFEFVPVEGVNDFPADYVLNVAEEDVTLKAGYAWLAVPAVAGSITYSEPQELSAQGVRYAKQLRAFLAHDDSVNRALLQQYLFAKVIVRYKDFTGNWKLTGSPAEPLRLALNFETAEFAGQIGYRISLSGTHGIFSRYLLKRDLGTISIDADGKLVVSAALDGVISLDADGKLVASGPEANRYSLDSQGRLRFT